MAARSLRRPFRAAAILSGALAFALSISGSAVAHHSHAHYEDEDVSLVLEGTIKTFEWRAPHSWVTLTVVNEETGEPEDWLLEGNPPARLIREGWRENSLEPGDQVAITVRPLKNRGKGGLIRRVDFADGSYLVDPQVLQVRERERDQLEQSGTLIPDLGRTLGP